MGLVLKVQTKPILQFTKHRILLCHVFKLFSGSIETFGGFLLRHNLLQLYHCVVQGLSQVPDQIRLKFLENARLQLAFQQDGHVIFVSLFQCTIQHQLFRIRSISL